MKIRFKFQKLLPSDYLDSKLLLTIKIFFIGIEFVYISIELVFNNLFLRFNYWGNYQNIKTTYTKTIFILNNFDNKCILIQNRLVLCTFGKIQFHLHFIVFHNSVILMEWYIE